MQLNPSFQEGSNPSDTELQDLRERLIDEHSTHVGLERPNPWWDKTFRWLIDDVSREVLSKNVCSVELFAYPSSRYAHRKPNVPSSSYQLDIVREALRGEALFIVTRGCHFWKSDVPELEALLQQTQLQKKRVFLTKNRQRAFISPGNLDDGVYEKIRSALKDGNR